MQHFSSWEWKSSFFPQEYFSTLTLSRTHLFLNYQSFEAGLSPCYCMLILHFKLPRLLIPILGTLFVSLCHIQHLLRQANTTGKKFSLSIWITVKSYKQNPGSRNLGPYCLRGKIVRFCSDLKLSLLVLVKILGTKWKLLFLVIEDICFTG